MDYDQVLKNCPIGTGILCFLRQVSQIFANSGSPCGSATGYRRGKMIRERKKFGMETPRTRGIRSSILVGAEKRSFKEHLCEKEKRFEACTT